MGSLRMNQLIGLLKKKQKKKTTTCEIQRGRGGLFCFSYFLLGNRSPNIFSLYSEVNPVYVGLIVLEQRQGKAALSGDLFHSDVIVHPPPPHLGLESQMPPNIN